MSRARFSRSDLFTAYNSAMRMAREGKLDAARLRRGFALAQSNRPIPYNATSRTCDCPDATIRKVLCKHQAAVALRQMAGYKVAVAA